MEMTGEYRIPAARETVWEALNDPEVLKACIAGCQSLDRTDEGGFEATVKAKVGPVSATFKGAVRLENVNAPESYTIVGEGKGGAAGFAKGGADVKLVEDGSDTILTYIVNAQVGGKLAQIGARLVDSTAKKYATDFFDKFVVIAKERDSGATDATVTPSDAAPEEPTQAAASGTAEMHQPEEEQPPRPAPQKPETVDRDAIKADAKRAAVDAVHKQTAKRWGLTPMQWIMILVLIMLGLSLVFGNDAQMPGTGK
ncbi:MAG: carbon monoxide dehydrogenase subunit G [Alphaproteobacteria bacterium]|nr:carbon monoxide dehydrogenase subunit G [Alphaproteobacteria bacterium]